ncbi:MAG: glutathione S-transferase family protein [Haliea sp.]|jgi:glutathione S-transferase|nr:glutathione S-transferase family protein [Haliea sp.]
MKLYTYDPAPNPRRLALFLKLKGLAIDTRQVDLLANEQLGDAYRQINPALSVPALVLDDGTVLTEVIGMYTYLDELHPQPPLMGSTAAERAQVISWCHRLFSGLMMAIAGALRNRGKSFINRALPGPLDTPQIPELVERGLLQIGYILPELDAHLANSKWVAGDNFSIADIDLLVCIDFLAWIRQSVPDECTHLKDWYQRACAHVA